MNITWNLSKADGCNFSCYAFSSPQRLVKAIRESGTVDFFIQHETKTSLDIEISSPGSDRDRFAIAHIPIGAEKFKFHEKTTYGVFDSKPCVRHHFKLTKTQGLTELKEYLTIVLKALVPEIENLNVNIVFYKIPEITI